MHKNTLDKRPLGNLRGTTGIELSVLQAARPCLAVELNCSKPVRILYDAGAIDPNGAFERE